MSAMSTPITTPTSTDHPYPTPYTPQERAFARYCEGLRSPAIAKQLGVSERTVRAWIAATRDELAADRASTAQAAASLAEARQLQIAAAAWDGYRRVAAAEQLQLDELQEGTHDELAAPPPTPRRRRCPLPRPRPARHRPRR